MIRFNNDYNRGAHPAILEALARTNGESYGGYGLDEWCERGAAAIKAHLNCPHAQVHFLVGGTQTNYTVISHALRPWESVLTADTGHIHVHETGAVEHIAHKLEVLPAVDGKITAAQIAEAAELCLTSTVPEHITHPKMVYLSFPTELGTIYSKAELEAMSAACRSYDLYLFVDGARMGYGLGSPENDLTLADLARLADVFYIGGTKCGALFGEAVVITNPAIDEWFRCSIKQNGGMLAKGWLLGLQFATLFESGLYFDITKKACEQAMRIKHAFANADIPLFVDSPTNQQFVVLNDAQMARLAENYVFEFQEKLADGRSAVRFCTSWSTTDEEVDALVRDIATL